MQTIMPQLASNTAFTEKAARYAAAMSGFPRAREAEFAEIAALAGRRGGTALDLFGGTGILADRLAPSFRRIDIIDQTAALLPAPASKIRVFEGDACSDAGLEQLPGGYEVAVCLAGFHHVIAEGVGSAAACDSTGVEDLRLDALSRWRSLLRPGGRLILADVPRATNSQYDTTPEITTVTPKLAQTLQLLAVEARASTFFAKTPEPADFFDAFVTSECPNGHTASFETADHISQMMRKTGYINVRTSVRITPWYFGNARNAFWFVHELFGIGPSAVSKPAALPDDRLALVRSGVSEFLGLRETKNGCLLGWKLLYASGERSR